MSSLELRAVELLNWMPFRGRHRVEIPRGPVVLTGEREGEPDRSNWTGKSSFLESVAWALFGGSGRFRMESDLITRGEEQARVTVELSDGTIVTRTRPRYKAGRITAVIGGEKWSGKAAQDAIDAHLGVDAATYGTSVHIRQGDAMGLVTATDSERRRIVLGWLDVDAWQNVLDEAAAAARQAGLDEATARRRLDELVDVPAVDPRVEDILTGHGVADLDDCASRISEAIEALERTVNDRIVAANAARLAEQSRIESARASHEAQMVAYEAQREAVAARNATARASHAARVEAYNGALKRYQRDVEERAEAVHAMRELRGRMISPEIEFGEAAELSAAAAAMEARAEADLATASAWATGGQRCPFTSLECPVADEVTPRMVALEEGAQRLREDADALRLTAQDAAQREEDARREQNRVEVARVEYRRLYERLSRPKVEPPQALGPLPEVEPEPTPPPPFTVGPRSYPDPDVSAEVEEIRRLGAALGILRDETMRRERVAASIRARETAEVELSRATERRRVLVLVQRCLRSISGPVATAQARIEERVAYLLHGSDLRFRMEWVRPTARLAPVCECGHDMGARSKRRTCVVCGARRPRDVEPFLTLSVDDGSGFDDVREKSGGARALAAVAIRLAASASTPHNRVGWRVLDEGMSELDAHNVACFLDLVNRACDTEAGQILMVSHDSRILNSGVSRIRVSRSRDASRVTSG